MDRNIKSSQPVGQFNHGDYGEYDDGDKNNTFTKSYKQQLLKCTLNEGLKINVNLHGNHSIILINVVIGQKYLWKLDRLINKEKIKIHHLPVFYLHFQAMKIKLK